MELSEIWRYPVKSMMGERVDAAEVTAVGMVGDRAWATRDEVRGGIRGAKKIAPLMRLAASYNDGPGSTVTITLPDGTRTSTDDPDRDASVSAALDHAVTLWPLQPAEDLDHYRRGAPDSDDLMEELNAVFGREDGEPLPDLSVFPPEILEYESPPGTYVDAFPMLVLTTSALRSLREAVPDSVVDVRRFRPNLVIDTGDQPGHPEFDWVGRQLRVGGLELDVRTACPRCVMVTREVDDTVPADGAVLRHIVRDLDQNVGVYATVTVPGRVARGDTVQVLTP
jgi:uncharacterized protein YcbX